MCVCAFHPLVVEGEGEMRWITLFKVTGGVQFVSKSRADHIRWTSGKLSMVSSLYKERDVERC